MAASITYDQALIYEIAARFDLREPNRLALKATIQALSSGGGEYQELIADLATGVGKTFLMSSLIDYVAAQGVRHILVVTPGSVIQRKTLSNFDAASTKYVAGADHQPVLITPDNFQSGAVSVALRDPNQLKVFVFNVQQLIRPSQQISRKVRDVDEHLGDALYAYLQQAEDLLIIADEHHIYHEKAKSFSAAIRDLDPLALVGLTATPAAGDSSKVIFQYTLGEAIADGHVKIPVIVYRKDGTKDERTQLADACHLLRQKEVSYAQFVETRPDFPQVKPILFVVCSSIEHAGQVGQLLAQDGFIGDPGAVLEVTSQSSDEALAALADAESPKSPIRAIVSVNMLREGWDVKNIAVIVALRRLASQTLTEQILGRGLRLPFGVRTDAPMVDQVDVVAHDSYKQLLAQKDVLRQRIQASPAAIEVDDQGAATTAGGLSIPDPTVPTGTDSGTGETDLAVGVFPEAGGSLTGGANGLQVVTFTTDDDDVESAAPALFFIESEERREEEPSELRSRVEGAPQITFPRREARLTFAAFTLADIPDGDAQAAGARFISEVPSFLAKDALVASREGGDVTIKVAPMKNVEAQQSLTGIDTIRQDLVAAILRQVAETVTEKNGAKRIMKAFLRGAGVTSETHTAEWGENRRQQAINGMSTLIQQSYAKRSRQMTYELVPITLPIEPVLVDGSARDAYNDGFVKHVQFVGWQRNVMPVASFDAGSTEWKLAQLLDRDDSIRWWLRLYTNGPAYVPTTDGNYFPDLIALDAQGVYWLIEGKSDKNANDADVLRKKEAAEHWARSVRDDDNYGEWHYLFATETQIRNAAGSWAGLKVATNPE
ncbi:DEAD/DEAH box helicase [Paenarthrobacter ureafaciens]|uniref:DEAD/DEAH box helicase n=1 Tax=Paenarthrobacter ureafaciens TaxID=37931 RepID=UPI001C2B952B